MAAGLAILAEVRDADRPAGADGRARRRSNAPRRRRRWTCCRSPPSCAGRPTCCWPPGETGRAINVKKGQFLAPWDMGNVAAKIASTGNRNILLCERGASFGYNTLVTDMRSLPIMARDRLSGGVRRDAFRAAAGRAGRRHRAASGSSRRCWRAPRWRSACAAVFIETHPDPDQAPSDGPEHDPAAGDGGAGGAAGGVRPAQQVCVTTDRTGPSAGAVPGAAGGDGAGPPGSVPTFRVSGKIFALVRAGRRPRRGVVQGAAGRAGDPDGGGRGPVLPAALCRA